MSVKYIYILSQRYSGSTLLSFLLATHPEISTIGERRKFYVKSLRPQGQTGQQCSCGLLFQDCPFWNAVKTRVLEQVDPQVLASNAAEFQLFNNKYLNRIGQDLWQAALLHQLPLRDQLFAKKRKGFTQFNRILVESILELEGNQVFLDSSKEVKHALFLTQIPDFDLQVIWLSRDPRAQVASALKYNKWTVEEATNRWKQEMDENQWVLDKMGARYKKLSYEVLCKDPEKEMVKLLDFVGLDPTAFSLDFRAQTQHIMGNYSMRLGKDTRIEERKDWLQLLSAEQIALIEKLTVDYQEYYSK